MTNCDRHLSMDDKKRLGLLWSFQQRQTEFHLLEEHIQAAQTEADELEEQLMVTNFTLSALLAEKCTRIPCKRTVHIRLGR